MCRIDIEAATTTLLQWLSKHSAEAFVCGTPVALTGLRDRIELNGRHGKLVAWDNEAQRYQVLLSDISKDVIHETMLVRPANITELYESTLRYWGVGGKHGASLQPGDHVMITGVLGEIFCKGRLQAKPELNGQIAICEEYCAYTGHWDVRLLNGEEAGALKPSNLKHEDAGLVQWLARQNATLNQVAREMLEICGGPPRHSTINHTCFPMPFRRSLVVVILAMADTHLDHHALSLVIHELGDMYANEFAKHG